MNSSTSAKPRLNAEAAYENGHLIARDLLERIGELVRQSDHPLHLADFCKYIGTKDASRAAHHVRRAERAGLMRKIGHQGGWVPME